MATSRPPGRAPAHSSTRSGPSTLGTVLASLAWVLAGVLSLLTGLIALFTVLAMAHEAGPERPEWLLWTIALLVTLGAPFALAAWRHWRDPTRLKTTLAWLPMVWNSAGVLVGIALVPEFVGGALRNAEWIVEGERFGPTHTVTQSLSAFGGAAAEQIDPGGEKLIAPTPRETAVDPERTLTLPIDPKGNSIYVDIELVGRDGKSVERRYVFDTGASFTTISSATAKELGIEVPDDAPTVQFSTAAGFQTSRVVYLPGLRVGELEVPSLVVSVCDACATERAAGLLGLNVMREFVVQVDYQAQEIKLQPRVHDREADRAYDINSVTRLAMQGRAEIMIGRVRWMIEVENLSEVPLYDVVPMVEFTDGPTLYGETIPEIAPRQKGSSLVTGPVGDGPTGGQARREFTMSISEARW